MLKAEIVLDTKSILGEGPVWDDRENVLYWVDIKKCELHIFDPVKNKDRVIITDQPIGTVVPGKKKNSLVLAMENGFYFLDVLTGKTEFIGDPEKDKPDNRFNDGKCDPAGRFFAGTMGKQGGREAGALYMLDTDTGLSISKVLDKISISNGIVWSRDKKTMYYIDSPVKKVWAFDYDLSTGRIGNRRDAIDGTAEPGVFDGMTDDSRGILWIAYYRGGRVAAWDPVTGKKLEEIEVPAPHVTACAFGGKDLDTLYITTGRQGMTEAELKAWPQAGGLFTVKPGVSGVKAYRFGA